MQLKVTPSVGPRYWIAILAASMCGTNLGDIVPDVLKLSAFAGLIMLACIFALLVFSERASANGSEAYYWIAILVVRAAATNIADYSIAHLHLTYLSVIAALTLLFCGICLLQTRAGASQNGETLPPIGGSYWSTMLLAGTLGTVIGDALGHSFSTVQVGVPISGLLATLALLLIWVARRRMEWLNATICYWVAVVCVRWWGTNAGDVLAFLLSLISSAVVTGSALAIVLLIWRES